MSTDIRHRLGAQGEQHAADHLNCLGFRVVGRNVRTPAGEIDIIAVTADTVVFCEVKTRRCGTPVGPLEGLRPNQRHRIRTAAAVWLGGDGRHARRATVRFDAIGILIDRRGELAVLEHLEGCF